MERRDNENNHQLDINNLEISGSHRFINIRTKIKNPALGNDTAWIIAQPLLSACVRNYPQDLSLDLEPVRRVFDLRRDTFLGRIEAKDASSRVRETIDALPSEQQERITKAVVCIRDFFDKPSPYKKHRRA